MRGVRLPCARCGAEPVIAAGRAGLGAHLARCCSVRHDPITDQTPGTALGSLRSQRNRRRGAA